MKQELTQTYTQAMHLHSVPIFDDEIDEPLLGGRDAALLEDVEGYAAPGCWHTRKTTSE